MRICLHCRRTHDSGNWTCPHCGAAPQREDGIIVFAPDMADATDGYDAAAFADLARFEGANFWFRSRNRVITGFIRECFPGARKFLELGVGTGAVHNAIAGSFPELELHASEVLLAGLRLARMHVPARTSLYQMHAGAIPFSGEFDLIGAFDVIEHIDDDAAALTSMRRALRAGGGILLTVPQHPWLWSSQDVRAHHKRRYTAAELHGKIERAGFRILRSTSFVSLLLPALAWTRWRERGRPAAQGTAATGLDLPAPLNSALYGVMEAERRLLLSWLNLPFGGSRIVAARAVA